MHGCLSGDGSHHGCPPWHLSVYPPINIRRVPVSPHCSPISYDQSFQIVVSLIDGKHVTVAFLPFPLLSVDETSFYTGKAHLHLCCYCSPPTLLFYMRHGLLRSISKNESNNYLLDTMAQAQWGGLHRYYRVGKSMFKVVHMETYKQVL